MVLRAPILAKMWRMEVGRHLAAWIGAWKGMEQKLEMRDWTGWSEQKTTDLRTEPRLECVVRFVD